MSVHAFLCPTVTAHVVVACVVVVSCVAFKRACTSTEEPMLKRRRNDADRGARRLLAVQQMLALDATIFRFLAPEYLRMLHSSRS